MRYIAVAASVAFILAITAGCVSQRGDGMSQDEVDAIVKIIKENP